MSDNEWFGEIYEKYYDFLLKKYLKRAKISKEEKEDYIQDAAIKSLEKKDDLKKEGSISYFTLTAKLNAINKPTRRKKTVRYTETYESDLFGFSPSSLDLILEKEASEQAEQNIKLLYSAIETLPPRYQLAIKNFLQGKPIGDFYASNKAKVLLYNELKNKIKR